MVGVDTTPTSGRALDWAIQEAELEHRALTLVHAVGNAVAACVELERRDLAEVIEDMVAQGRRTLEAAAARVSLLSPQTQVRQVLRLSSPHQALMALADDAALLVVGPHTRGPHRGEPISSGTDLAARRPAGAPVAVAGGGVLPDVAGEGILVVLDGNLASRPTLEAAFRHAAQHHLLLTVVHCLADPNGAASDVDLWLMDATARATSKDGPSLLGFEHQLLGVMFREVKARHSGVSAHLVLAASAVDYVLQRACTSMDYVVISSRHALRASECIFRDWDPATTRCVTVILPGDHVQGDGDAVEQMMEAAETGVVTTEIEELEECFAAPAVEPPRPVAAPVQVRRRIATHHLLHRMQHLPREDRDV